MKKPNYEFEQVCLIESLGEKLGNGIHELEIDLLKKNLLELTKRERFRLAKLECEDESTTTT